MIPQEIMQQIRRIQIRTNRMVNELLAGKYESVFKGRGVEFKEVREYVAGDDIRMIDWNVTARSGTPHVKVLAEERELTVMLMVDASASGTFGTVRRLKKELAAEFCAAMAISAIQSSDKVGLIVFTDEVELYVPPGKGRRHVSRVIRETLFFEPKRRGTNIAEALHFMNRVLRRRAVVFLVSDFLAGGYGDALSVANRRHDVIATVVTDPREESLPDTGLVAVVDPETGARTTIDTSDASVRGQYWQVMAQHAKQRDQVFHRSRVDTIRIRTDRPYMDEVYRFFRMRERRHG